MKKICLLFIALSFFAFGCQKSISTEREDNGEEGTAGDFSPGDSITYEVITKDTTGWFGLWTDQNGEVQGNSLDHVDWGSPVYELSGWKYTFVWDGYASQLMMSVFNASFEKDITINLYKNDELIKLVTNDKLKGCAKILYNIDGDTLQGTATDPVLTYEVLIDQMDTTKYQSDAWNGDWFNKDEVNIVIDNRLTTMLPIPSGWRYNFKPGHLPFTMNLQAWPYTKNGSRVTMNFYVNGVLVKSSYANDIVYPPMTYMVQ